MRDNPEKSGIIPHMPFEVKLYALKDVPAGYQLVGEVMAHQGYDG